MAVVGRDVEHDVRVRADERAQLGPHDRLRGQSRDQKPNLPNRALLEPRDLRQRAPNVGQGRSHARQQLVASLRRRHAPRGSRQQSHPDVVFEASDGVTQPRLGDVQALGRAREASLLRHGEERGQHAQFVTHHCSILVNSPFTVYRLLSLVRGRYAGIRRKQSLGRLSHWAGSDGGDSHAHLEKRH